MRVIIFIFFFLSQSSLFSQKTISIKDYGVDGVEYKNESQISKYNRYLKIKQAFENAILKRNNIFFPKGVYDVGNRNFPFRTPDDVKGNELLDCRGITIYGEKGTILKTTSEYGADVLQLNKVKNLAIKDVEITAKLEKYTRSGSNGISITNGFDNIFLENIKIYDLPGVDKGTYIDGGKGLTLQFSKGNKSYKGKLIAKKIRIENCAYGFRMDAVDVSDLLDFNKSVDILLELKINNAYQGFSIEYGATGKNIQTEKGGINIRADVDLDNCQQYVRLSRVVGGNFNITVQKTNEKLNKIWNKSDKLSFALLGNYIKNAKVTIRGDVGKIDEKILLGAVGSIIEPFNMKNATENSIFNIDIVGKSVKNDFTLIEYLGDSVNDSELNITSRSLDKNSNIKKKLSRDKNKIQIKNHID